MFGLRWLHILFLLPVIIPVTSLLAQPSLSGNLSKTRIGDQEYVQAEYVIENATTLSSFKEPSFDGFNIIGVQKPFGQVINNGKLNRYYAFIYTLEPLKAGIFNISQATAVADGKTLSSKLMKVMVVNGKSIAAPPGVSLVVSLRTTSRLSPAMINDFVLNENENAAEKVKKYVFVKVETNKAEVFEGEPILTTYKLYSRLRNEARIVKRPSFNGFSVYEMPDNGWNTPDVETINGKRYEVYTVRKAQLFPLQEGAVQLEPVEIETKAKLIKQAVLKNMDIGADQLIENYFYNTLGDDLTETVSLTIRTEPVTISVKALPIGPDGFKGAVGNYQLSVMMDRDSCRTGEATVLRLKISGSGNLPVINAPVIDWPKGVESFEPKVKEDYDPLSVPLSGEKTFEYSFVPVHEGDLVIPPISFTYFDPTAKQYRGLNNPSFTVQVRKGSSEYKAKSNEVSSDKRSNRRKFYDFAGGKWLLALIGLVATILFLYKWNRRQKKEEDDKERKQWQEIMEDQPTLETVIPVVKEEKDLLSEARSNISQSPKIFYDALQKDLWRFLQGKKGITVRGKNLVKEYLLNNGSSAEDAEKIIQLINRCETVIYSPADTGEDHAALLNETENLLERLS